jgi:hypothetical protein
MESADAGSINKNGRLRRAAFTKERPKIDGRLCKGLRAPDPSYNGWITTGRHPKLFHSRRIYKSSLDNWDIVSQVARFSFMAARYSLGKTPKRDRNARPK